MDRNPNLFLTRNATAAALREMGFPLKAATLADKACREGGPVYRKFGRNVLYKWQDVLDWAEAQLGPPMRTSGEAPVAGHYQKEKATEGD